MLSEKELKLAGECGHIIYRSERVSVRIKDSNEELRIRLYPVRRGKEVIECVGVLTYVYPKTRKRK